MKLTWAIAASAFLLGLGAGYLIFHAPERPPVIEGPAPAIPIPGGQVLARDPNAEIPPPPPGTPGRVVRQTRVIAEATVPGPMTLDLTLLEQRDHTFRMAVTSPDGTVIGGVDVPVQPLFTEAPRKVLRRGLGVSYGLSSRSWGLQATQDFGRLALGLELAQYPSGQWRAYEVRTSVVFKF